MPQRDWPEPPLVVAPDLADFLERRRGLFVVLERTLEQRDRVSHPAIRAPLQRQGDEIAAVLKGERI